ncbi:olfactory receptor 5D13-like isoform X1 [Hydra vulgaris]|uniref:olfactory receptor 5D13-like isoform X1 n=1 Tax=Hydra vulgaris TaxID=6087 RepID=UPI0032EA3A2E
MSSNKDAICKYQYKDMVEYTNSRFLISCYTFNAVFTLATNGFLVLGLHLTNKNKKYTRNEKLVIVLSITDILYALIVSPSQSVLLKLIDNFGCLEISIISFFRIWLLGLSSSTFIIISCERYLTVFYNSKICGVTIKDSYLFGYLSIVIIFTCNTAVLYSAVYASSSLHLQFILYIGTGFITLASLFLIVVANLLMLVQTKKKLKSSIQVQKNIKIKNYITKTVVIISLTHVLFYAPCLIAQFYLSFVFTKNNVFQIPAVYRVLMWTVVIREVNSWINPLIYVFRNRKVSKIFGSRINSLLSNLNLKAKSTYETTSNCRSTSPI